MAVTNSLQAPEQVEALRAFRMVVRAVRRHYQLMEKHAGISGAQTWALSLVAEQGRMTVSGLAQAMAIHQSTASNLVDKLVQLGLISRIKGEVDLRVTYLQVTTEGRDKLDGIAGPVTGLLPDALTRMEPKKLERLNRGLADLLAMLAAVETEAARIPVGEPLRA